MTQVAKDNKFIIEEDEMTVKVLEGAKAAYDVVTTSYGPKGKNVLIEKPFGRPRVTRDGLTIIRDVYFSDRAKNMGAQVLLEAAESSNRIAGDGSTAVTALAYNLIKNGVQAIAAGVHPMEVSNTLTQDGYKLQERLDELARPVEEGQLVQVATVSSGSPLLGELIAGAVEYVGADGGIITEKAPVDDIEREYVDGYYLQSGFQAIQAGKKDLNNPLVIVSVKRLSSAAELADVLTEALRAKNFNPETGGIPRFLLIGNIEDSAYVNAVNLNNERKIDVIVLKTPPQFGEMGKQLLEDIAVYANCKPIADNTNTHELNASYVGTIDKVTASKSESTLFADNTTEAVMTRVQELKDQMKTEVVDAISEKLRDRVAKLEGKIALFRIGGATDTAKEEKEDRIEDAINATRHASNYGVVAGGGITLLELSKLDISDYYKKALQDTFKKLLTNANLPAEIKLNEALLAPVGHGFNLRKDDKLVDMFESGILDPKFVIEQIIKHATQAASDALTVGVGLVFEDKKE